MKSKKILTSVYLTFPFIMAISLSIRMIFLYQVQNDETSEINWNHQALFLAFLMFISELIAGSSYLLLSKVHKQRSASTHFLILKNYQVEAVTYSSLKANIKTFLFLLLSTTLDLIGMLAILYLPSCFGEASQITFALKCLQIISIGILCYYMLNFGFYRHQYVAIGLVLIGIGFVTWNNIEAEFHSLAHLVCLIVFLLIVSIQQTLDRWILDERNLIPLQLLFFEGSIGTFLSGLTFLILSFITCPNSLSFICKPGHKMEDLPGLFRQSNWFVCIFLIVYTLCSGLYNLFCRYSNFYLTPTHSSISDTLSTFALWVYLIIMHKNHEEGFEYASTIIGYAILVFGCLFYNEIIILRFCNLSYYTREEIINRADIDMTIESSQLFLDEEERSIVP